MLGQSTLRWGVIGAVAAAAWLTISLAGAGAGASQAAPGLAPLPDLAAPPDPAQVALGHKLFFDVRLSGDATSSCATCHRPGQAFTDGLPLSKGYPGSLYFRNTPSLYNVADQRSLYWDGRVAGNDVAKVVRDHIGEAHFLQADRGLVTERLRQVPAYDVEFSQVFGAAWGFDGVVQSLAAFVTSLRTPDAPLDLHLRGDAGALSPEAARGLAVFTGNGGCVLCHHGPMLTDHEYRGGGIALTPEIFRSPERHITFRRFLKGMGVAEYATLRADPGRYAVTQREPDRLRFRVPSLRNVALTAPYMHDGSFGTLEEVVEYYSEGAAFGGPGVDSALRPRGLTDGEKSDLIIFLRSLTGILPEVSVPQPPAYEVRPPAPKKD